MAVTLRSNLQTVTLPVISRAFNGRFKQHQPEWQQVFEEGTPVQRSSHIEPVMSTLLAAQSKSEGAVYYQDNARQDYQSEYFFNTYVMGAALSEEAEEDGEAINIASLLGKNCADALIETQELLGVDVLNRGFTALALGGYGVGDGVPLFSDQHLANNSNTGSNLGTAAALSEASVEEMLIIARTFRDSKGNYRSVTPQALHVPPALLYQAQRICASVLRPGTNNNDVNAHKSLGMLPKGVQVMTRLSSPRAYFMSTDAPQGAQVFFRAKSQTQFGVSDPMTNNKLFRARCRVAFGVTNWISLIGNSGA